ncbi:MAG: hypothetical protein ABSE62_11970 [Chthoniobacteraceae bacterium]|jgi:hypothetical protein
MIVRQSQLFPAARMPGFVFLIPRCLAFLVILQSIARADDSSTVTSIETRPGFLRSNYFGFSISIPNPWTVVLPKEPHQFQTAGGDTLVRDKVLGRQVVNADQENTQNLAEITNLWDTASSFVPSIKIIAEGIHDGAPFHTAEGYIDYTASLLMKIRAFQ